MERLFLTILNMSFNGAFAVVIICLARLLIKRAPKIISYCLWAVAGLRLVSPFSIESVYSLNPFKARIIPQDIASQPALSIDSGIPFINNAVISILPKSNSMNPSANPLRLWTALGSCLWLVGAAVMLAFCVALYFRLKHKMASAIRIEGNLYETDGIQSPFVLGVLKPKIYIPLNLSEHEREYIILHERTHIRRHDYIIKLAAYFILCLHWYNPLVWAAFLLMGLDLEMSCDERVLKELGGGFNKDYSMSLLSMAAGRRVISGSALAFGEDGVKKRIKNALRYRKSSRIALLPAIALAMALSFGLVLNRADTGGIIAPDGGANAGRLYAISGYYDEDGKFSDLGLALDERDSERVLTVSDGDILIVGDRQYEVTADSLALSFYTQPSIDQVAQWWTDYLDSWAESGKIQFISFLADANSGGAE